MLETANAILATYAPACRLEQGRGGFLNPEGPIVLIPGENAMVFIPHGYGFSVLVGHVEAEYPYGWVLNPARTVERTANDRSEDFIPLAGGKDKRLRKDTEYGPPIEGGARIPMGVMSLPWQGELPG